MKQSTLIVVVLGCLFLAATSVRVRKPDTAFSSKGSADNEINSNGDLTSQLMSTPTEVGRIKLLNQNSDFIFDFRNPPTNKSTVSNSGGTVVVADRAIFPALVGTDQAIAVGFIGACGLSLPHTHPRASEIFYSVNGTFATGFIQENGARNINNTLYPGQAAVFPMGSIHYATNLGCDSVEFISTFSNEDPGTDYISKNFFGIDEGILSAALGGVDENTLQSITKNLPGNVALGLQDCLQKCGLSRDGGSSN